MKHFGCVDDVMEDLFNVIKFDGEQSSDRTGVGTRRSFGYSCRLKFNGKLFVPVFKPVNIKAVGAELYCFSRGITNVDELKKHGCNWWEANLQDANKRWGTPGNRNLGPVYGAQWVKPINSYHPTAGVSSQNNQLSNLVSTLKNNPSDRRMYVTAWNPEEFEQMALPPCYHGFQCFVNEHNELDLMFHMRSADILLGLPHDILLHHLLQIMLAAETGRRVGDLLFTLGDYHIYNNHIDAVAEFTKRMRDPLRVRDNDERVPGISSIESTFLSDFGVDDLQRMIDAYKPRPNIKVNMAV